MLSIRTELRTLLANAVRSAQDAGKLPAGEMPEILVEVPPERGGTPLGDYASPVALSLAKTWEKPPEEIAQAIVSRLSPSEFIDRVTVAAPGFINIWLSDAWLSAKLDNLLREGASLGRQDLGRGQSVNIEFVSANPTGMPHVGHGRSLFVADMLARVLEHTGYSVTREYYLNDRGTQVAKYGESVLRRILQLEGHTLEFPEGLYQGEDVREIAARVREVIKEDRGHTFSPEDLNNPELLSEVSRRAVDLTMQNIRHVLEEVAGVRFDVWFPESGLHDEGQVATVLEALKKSGHLFERDGALWLKSTAFGDTRDRVLVKQNGELTYLVPDLAYHRNKLARGFQVVANFWGADHHAQIASLKAGLRALGEDADRVRVELVHMVRVLRGGEVKKLSKRLGTAVPLQEVLKLVGVSATRFFLTMKPLSSPFDFDLDLAVSQKEENPVYYAQYAYVRLTSILRKAKERNLIDEVLVTSWQESPVTLSHEAEHRLMALVMRFPDVLEDIARTWEVQRLPQYVLDLARAVHRFYDAVPVLSVQEGDLVRGRLVLTLAIHAVLEKVFDLLGIEKPTVM